MPDLLDQISIFVTSLSSAGSQYSDACTLLKKFIQNNPEPENYKHISMLFNEDRRIESLNHFLGLVENANKDNIKCIKDDLLLCFHIIGINDPLVNEYRKKLSRLLF